MTDAIPNLALNEFAVLGFEVIKGSEQLLLGTHGLHGILVHGVTEQSKAGGAGVAKDCFGGFAKTYKNASHHLGR